MKPTRYPNNIQCRKLKETYKIQRKSVNIALQKKIKIDFKIPTRNPMVKGSQKNLQNTKKY